MITVVGVRFKPAGKLYYFDPGELDIMEGSQVIVETSRGMEFGFVTTGPRKVSESSIVKPLKRVVRIADENDVKKYEENMHHKEKVLETCQAKIDARKLEMKLIDVEFTFDNTKVIFYFIAEGRVDFRELVKDLAGIFRTRIELRQVGVRDEAKMFGGIGSCGKGLCCHTWMSEFSPVSIKMAKQQGLSLNPSKISGACGRLMCCLRYEKDAYQYLKKGMPDVGEYVKTPQGKALVVDTNLLRESVSVRHVLPPDKKKSSEERLSSDIKVYSKIDVHSLDKKKKHKQEQKEDDYLTLPDEIKKLLED